MGIADIPAGTVEAMRGIGAYASDLVEPTVRLGVTGLARSGKTVLTTALVHNLIAGGRLPFFRAVAEGRIVRAYLQPQPDDAVPRFDLEGHLDRLAADPPVWPESTTRLSELRVTLDYAPSSPWRRLLGTRRLHLDIVDYPGEWLADLPLLERSFADWSGEVIAAAELPSRSPYADPFLSYVANLDADATVEEPALRKGAELFRAYLSAARSRSGAHDGISPGRFLMPGDLAGSPALTFFPLRLEARPEPKSGSLASTLSRRYLAYRKHVVKPFFRDHFSRLDRQVVLIDALGAIERGPESTGDLGRALEGVLRAFRPGANTFLTSLLARRIDRIVFAATKADHLHHTSHDRLEGLLGEIAQRAIERARFSGARIKVMAVAAIRATREGSRKDGGREMPLIVGTPMPGERLDGDAFDGQREVALFAGDLPDRLADLSPASEAPPARFLRFRPPPLAGSAAEGRPPYPHIRLDRLLDFLIGDRLT